jgi:hypothetical protein
MIPVRAVGTPERTAHRPEPPYRLFIATSLAVAVGGGFVLALLLPLARALAWDWGRSWQPAAQAHGQLQLGGFVAIFIAGMALRMMPRFSGRPLAFASTGAAIAPLLAAAVLLRAAALPAADGAGRDVVLVAGAVLGAAGALLFAAIVWGTLLSRESRAEATAWFFLLGAAALAAQSVLLLALTAEMVRDSLEMLPPAKDEALVTLQLYAFAVMFIGGVGTRAVPTLTGNERPQAAARVAAFALAAGAAVASGAEAWSGFRGASEALARAADVGLLTAAGGVAALAWGTGVVRPRADRVAAASHLPFWFVRAGVGWMVIGAGLLAWYAAHALHDGRPPDSFEADAARHTFTLGVVTMLILGMGMLLLPEFAGRRLQRPNERVLPTAMLVALNAAVVLRVWPAMRGLHWLSDDRYWPMAASGALAEAAVLAFALMFAQSAWEQRTPAWGARPGQH